MRGKANPEMLAWVAREGRVLLTHDVNTLVNDFYERVRQGLPAPGVIAVIRDTPNRLALNDLEVMIGVA